MDEFRRLTYKTPDGAWGIEGVSLLTCPARLYGTAAKLCDMRCEPKPSTAAAQVVRMAIKREGGAE